MEMWLKHPKELSFDGDCSNSKLSTVMQSNFSIATVKSNEVEKKRKKKLKNYFEFAAIVLRVIIAAVFGDPTQVIVAAIRFHNYLMCTAMKHKHKLFAVHLSLPRCILQFAVPMDQLDEGSHFSHPQHRLSHANAELLFVCEGCRRVGIGSRFTCSLCNFEFHTYCTTTPTSATFRHDFFPECQFKFHHCPPGDSPRRCNACGQDANGFVYHCRNCGYNLHPCCATLPHVIRVDDGLQLHLHPKASAPCRRCKRIGNSWSYRSNMENYNLHIACATEMWLDNRHQLHYDGDGSHGEVAMVLRNRLPITGAAGSNHHRSWKEKVHKCIKLASKIVQFIVAAMFGDPTHMITAVISSLQS